MKRAIGGASVLMLAVGGVAGFLAAGGARPFPAAAAPGAATPALATPPAGAMDLRPDSVVAVAGGTPITFAEMQRPLVEAYGLKVLVPQVMLAVAKQEARRQGFTVTDADYAAEFDRTLKIAFEDQPQSDYPALLDQLLAKQNMGRSEFDMIISTNAVLRKIAAPQVHQQIEDKITEEKLQEAFNARFGETVIIRHIQCSNPQQAALAKNRIAAGEKFESVVRAMSQNFKTAAVEGVLPKFSRQTDSWGPGWGKIPQGFKDWAFTAKVGDISDIIQSEGFFHILKLDQRIAPKIVKFDPPMRKILKDEIEGKAMENAMAELRFKLAQISRDSLEIKEPTLKKQYDAKLEEQRAAAATKKEDAEKARRDPLRGKAPGEPTLRNATEPPANDKGNQGTPGTPAATPGAAASPADAPAGERPPAIKSAAPGAADGTPTPSPK